MCGAVRPGHADATVTYGAAPRSTCTRSGPGGRCPAGPLCMTKERRSWIFSKRLDAVLDAATRQPTPSNATAHGTSSPAARVANRGLPCAVKTVAGASTAPCTPAWIFGKTRTQAGAWAGGCPWRHRSARGDRSAVPSCGADFHRRATAGQRGGMTCRYPVRAAFSGAAFTGAPRRPAPVGVQPTTVPGAPSRGAGKAAASSRFALPLRRDRVVSTVSASERVETTPRKDAGRNRNRFNKGGLWIFNATRTAFRGSNARKSHPGIAEGHPFSPASQGHQAVGSGRVIPHEPLAG